MAKKLYLIDMSALWSSLSFQLCVLSQEREEERPLWPCFQSGSVLTFTTLLFRIYSSHEAICSTFAQRFSSVASWHFLSQWLLTSAQKAAAALTENAVTHMQTWHRHKGKQQTLRTLPHWASKSVQNNIRPKNTATNLYKSRHYFWGIKTLKILQPTTTNAHISCHNKTSGSWFFAKSCIKKQTYSDPHR